MLMTLLIKMYLGLRAVTVSIKPAGIPPYRVIEPHSFSMLWDMDERFSPFHQLWPTVHSAEKTLDDTERHESPGVYTH